MYNNIIFGATTKQMKCICYHFDLDFSNRLFWQVLSMTNLLLPTLDFHSSFIESILTHQKTATTRIFGTHDTDTVSSFNPQAVYHQLQARGNSENIQDTSIGEKKDEGTLFLATSNEKAFALCRCLSVIEKHFDELGEEEAKLECMKTGDELREVLRRFYPEAINDDKVYFIIFEVVEKYMKRFVQC